MSTSDAGFRRSDGAFAALLARSGGETGALLAAHDWASTPLGPVSGWSASLCTAVGLTLRAAAPLALLWGPDGVLIYNDAYAAIAGPRHPFAFGRPVGESWPEVAEFNAHVLRVALAGGTLRYRDQELPLARNGRVEPAWFDLDYSPVLDEAGRPAGVLAIVTETTRRMAVETALRASEAKFEAIANSIDQMIWSTRPDGFHDYFNQRWYDFTGVPEGSTDGEAWNGMFHPDDQARAWRVWRRSLETGEPYRIEYRLRHASGQYRWVLGRAQAVRGEGGRIQRWFGTCTDIQDLVEAREILARSRQDLEKEVAARTAERDRMWRLSTDLFLVARVDATVIAVNPAWTDLLGWTERELIGINFLSLVHPDDVDATADAAGSLGDGAKVFAFENRYRRRDGTYRRLSWTAVPEEGLIHAVARDVTVEREAAAELARAQEALRQAQKMEAVGQLTGGIAHDFNNLLTGIVGSLDLLRRRVANGRLDGVERYTAVAMASAERAAALTQRLLAFSRRQPLDPKPVEANRLVAGMEELLRRTLGPAVELELRLAPDLAPTLCDANQLESAVLNLAINARDAMPEGGRLRIGTENVRIDAAEPDAEAGEIAPGDYVEIRMEDTGTGMPPETLRRIFEPFFTTKPIGQGTGLGLSQLYGFAKQSGGHVRVASELGRGTVFRVYLPRHGGEVRAEADRPASRHDDAAGRAAAGETVLVVDDEAAVRMLIVETLAELGYATLEAADAATGLRLLRSSPRIKLLVTDVGLPDLDGRRFADAARAGRPDLRVLFVTGFAGDADVGQAELEPGAAMLTKPFGVERLAEKVREVMRENGVAAR